MKKSNLTIAVLASLILATNAFAADYKEGEVIVKFKADSPFANAMGAEEGRAITVDVDDTAKALDALQKRADVEYVEPNYKVTVEETPNDWPYSTSEWDDVDLPEAWNLTSSHAKTVTVALVDSGCDLNHPDLKNALVAGKSFVAGFDTPEDDAGHGTRVAGIVAAQGNNNNGMAGVAWDVNVKIMPLKFMKKDGTSTSGYISDAVSAIYYAVDNGASVINASWGFTSYSKALEDAVKYARDHGVLFVASAGNSGKDNDTNPHFPSNFKLDNVVSVAALNRYGDVAGFSNFGYYSVDVAAPGEGLKSTDKGDGYASWISGTSFAAPFVSAIAALVISENPTIGYQDLRDRIVKTTSMKSGYSQTLKDAGGVVNAYNAVKGINMHSVPNKNEWSAPEAQNADDGGLMAGAGGGKGGSCFIETAQDSNLLGAALALILLIALLAPCKKQDN